MANNSNKYCDVKTATGMCPAIPSYTAHYTKAFILLLVAVQLYIHCCAFVCFLSIALSSYIMDLVSCIMHHVEVK